MVMFNGNAYIANAPTGVSPPGAPWISLSSATSIPSLIQTVSSLQSVVQQQATTIRLFQRQVTTFQAQLASVASGYQRLLLTQKGIEITPSGNEILHEALLDRLLAIDAKISPTIIMPLRSALARLFSAVTDISGTRLPALSAANAVLEATQAAAEARLAAEEAGTQLQALKDAQQDAEVALNSLNDSAVAASVTELSERIADISGSFGGRLASLEAVPAFDDSALRSLIEDVSGGVASVAACLAEAEAAIQDVSGAVATKAAASALEAYITSNDAAVAAKAAASALEAYISSNDAAVAAKASEAAVEALESRVGAVESAVPTKVAQADYDVFVAASGASASSLDVRLADVEDNKADAEALAALDIRVAVAEGAVATKAEEAALEALDGRVAAVEGELPNKASGSDLTDALARVIVLENSNFAPKLEIQAAADYAAWAALGANKIARISSSPFALDAGEADNTILFAVAEIDVTFTSNGATVFEVVAGESVTLAKGAAGWSATAGIVPLASAPAPSEPSGGGGGATFPEAWSLLDDGGYTATLRTATLEEEEETEAELDGTVIVLYPAVPLESVRVWFEFGFGKVEAAALDGSRFYSPDFANLSLQDAAAVLITLSQDGSDEAVNHRVPITSVEGQ